MKRIPKHVSLYITHNEHKCIYQKLEDYVSFNEIILLFDSLEDYKECVKNDELWEVLWYPKTFGNFRSVFGPTLERCLEIIENTEFD